MEKIQKALQKLSEKERLQIRSILLSLKGGDWKGLNIQKLKGHRDVFRVRKGSIRIIYRQKGKEISILAIERRSKKTYKHL